MPDSTRALPRRAGLWLAICLGEPAAAQTALLSMPLSVKRHPELPPLRHEEVPPPSVHDVG